jgi:hypothetical protein
MKGPLENGPVSKSGGGLNRTVTRPISGTNPSVEGNTCVSTINGIENGCLSKPVSGIARILSLPKKELISRSLAGMSSTLNGPLSESGGGRKSILSGIGKTLLDGHVPSVAKPISASMTDGDEK